MLPVSGVVCEYFVEGDLSQTLILPQVEKKEKNQPLINSVLKEISCFLPVRWMILSTVLSH